MPHRIPPFLFRSVRGRLLLLVAALVVPVVALATAMVLQAYRNERTAVANTMLSTTRAVSGVLDAKLDEADAILRTVSTSSALAEDDLDHLDGRIRETLTGDSRWFVLLDVHAQQLVNTHLPRGSALPKIDLEPDFLSIMERGETYISDLKRSRATNELVIHVSRPYFRNGRLKYILTISIPPSVLAKAVDVNRYAPGKIVTVIDRRGTIIARSRNPDVFVGRSATPDLVRAISDRSEAIIDSVTLEEIPVVTAFSHARSGWATAIGAPISELYRSARRLLAWGLVGSAVLIIVAVLMAAWIGRALVRSTDVLEADAEALGRGQTPPNSSTGLDESDFVAQAMRRTAATLIRRTRSLEVLNRINATLVAEREIEKIAQQVIDAGRELSGARYGVFIYHAEDENGRPVVRYASSYDPTGQNVRLTPDTSDPLSPPMPTIDRPIRTGNIADAGGTPLRLPGLGIRGQGWLSFLAVPMRDSQGKSLGALMFGHPEAGVFTQEAEDLVVGLAAEAAIAIDNATLYQALARELAAKSKAEAGLREAQDRLKEHARDLERKVEERTASLREAVTQMEEFSYTVSHDLRGPLRAMHAFAEALIEDYGPRLDATAHDYLRRIQRASRRMDDLTRDLLNYSRVVRAEVQLAPTEIEPIVRSLIDHYAELQSPAALVTIEQPLHRVFAHAPSLTQCLANLLTNAAKFVRPGERPRITVRTTIAAPNRIKVWVEDQGIGISPEHQPSLFRIFERVPSQNSYEGTGVGLAIVRKAAEKMGGSCGVESDGRNGSHFWIELGSA